MGNRAVITFHTNPTQPAVYVHWNGGLASVLGFLQAQRELFSWDDSHDIAERTRQLHEVCAAYLGTSAYYEPELGVTDQDNWDNGTYVVDPATLLITQRLHVENCSSIARTGEEINAEKTADIALQCVQGVIAARTAPWFDPQPRLVPKGRRAAVRAAKGAGKARVVPARCECLPWFVLYQDRIDSHGRLTQEAA